jgi:hypothetical protein
VDGRVVSSSVAILLLLIVANLRSCRGLIWQNFYVKFSTDEGYVFSVHTMKVYKGRRSITPLIHSFSTTEMYVFEVTSQPLSPNEGTAVRAAKESR